MDNLDEVERLLELVPEPLRHPDAYATEINEFGVLFCPECSQTVSRGYGGLLKPHTCVWECGLCGARIDDKQRWLWHIQDCALRNHIRSR